MADVGPATSQELAQKTSLHERQLKTARAGSGHEMGLERDIDVGYFVRRTMRLSCAGHPGITKSLGNNGTLEAAQRIAGHAGSRTTKLYDRRGQKVLLEVERIRY